MQVKNFLNEPCKLGVELYILGVELYIALFGGLQYTGSHSCTVQPLFWLV